MDKLIEIAAIDMTIYKFVLPLMNELKKNRFEVSVASNNSGYKEKLEAKGYEVTQINFARNLSPIKNIIALIQLINLFKTNQPTFVHVHTPIASVLARIAAKITKVPNVIYTMHGLYKEKPFLQIEKFMCSHFTDYIFTVNEDDRIYLIENGFINPHKVKNLNSVGIDIQKFNPAIIDQAQKLELKKELKLQPKKTIGFIGRLVKEKGVPELIDSFIEIRKYTDCQLLLVGSTDLGERDSLNLKAIKQKLKQEGILKDVIFAGQREDIPLILSLIDIFVFPSHREGMAISPLEAMAMEVPVIATNIRGCKEEITFDTGLTVPVEDVKELTKAIKYLLDNPDKAQNMGKMARKHVKRYFSSTQIISKQMKVFEKLQAKSI